MDWDEWIDECPTGGAVFKDWLRKAPLLQESKKHRLSILRYIPLLKKKSEDDETEHRSDFNF